MKLTPTQIKALRIIRDNAEHATVTGIHGQTMLSLRKRKLIECENPRAVPAVRRYRCTVAGRAIK